jgi:hypothetical protein
MTQGCNNIVISWLYRTCWNNLALSLIISTRLLQIVHTHSLHVPNLLTTWDKQCEHNLLTACWQTCYKMWDSCGVYTWELTRARWIWYGTIAKTLVNSASKFERPVQWNHRHRDIDNPNDSCLLDRLWWNTVKRKRELQLSLTLSPVDRGFSETHSF